MSGAAISVFCRCLIRVVTSSHMKPSSKLWNYQRRNLMHIHFVLPSRACSISSSCDVNDKTIPLDRSNLIEPNSNRGDESNVLESKIEGTVLIEEHSDSDTTQLLVATDKMGIQPFEDDTNVDILAESGTPRILESYTKPALPSQSLTLQSFIQQSPTLQKLLELGVDLHKVQKRQGAAEMILKMDFDVDVKDKIALLHHLGVTSDHLGTFLTKNPHILGEDLKSLETRVMYLKSKKFTDEAIAMIVNRAPYFLCFSTESVDRKLGYFQKEFWLAGDEVRTVITRCPQLVTRKISRIQENMYVIHNQLGFSKPAMKEMIIKQPKLLLNGKNNLMNSFDYIHNDMGIPHSMLVHFPEVLRTRLFIIKERDMYLRKIGLAQYDPSKPHYISLKKLVEGPDKIFCQQIAKTSVEDFNNFLKTM
ncbi:transcription termination factor 3, mitochondrial-like [Anneissia japonica]|uniref:transcription termination factor 3, mitochondrial-like n=1 Tax=Anneissia japonica TaxID=1529436 RepID=UPI0014255CF4|nr:transcription termination factor 3, mitochondrial-like [Anneissia japonica]